MCKICERYDDNHSAPKEGELRVWWIPQVPDNEPFHRTVKNVEEAVLLMTALGDYDLYLEAHGHRVDYSNAGGLEVFENDEWNEWYDEEGRDIDELVDNNW